MKEKRKKKMLRQKNKKAMEIEVLGWWIIALVVLGVVLIGYLVLKGKGISALEYIKNLFRFRN